MLSRLVGLFIVACAVLPVNGLGTAGQEKKEPVAVITSPKKGAEVEQIDQVEGKLNSKEGWPVVLVRAVKDTEWWIQPPVDEVKDGEFSVQAHFGNNNTPGGTKFRIVIIVAKSKEAARKFKVDSTLKSLPPASSHPRSEYLDVVRK